MAPGLGYNNDKRGKHKRANIGLQKAQPTGSQVNGGVGIHHKDELNHSGDGQQGAWDTTMILVGKNKRGQTLVY